jgi:hypothetical protein
MSKSISVKTPSGTVSYKISQDGSRFYCQKYVDSFFGGWSDIGSARSLEDALSLIKSHAASKYGSVYSIKID